MAEPRFTEIEAVVFDAYGTLFDFASPVLRLRERIGGKAELLVAIWRRKQLEYSWLRTLMGRHSDFWHVTGDALDFAMASVGLADPVLRAELMQLYLDLDTYPDARPAIQQLKGAGFRTAILSNGTPTMLTAVVSRADLTRSLDAVLSVEGRGCYKPHPTVYQLAVDALGVAVPHICFVSANGWDSAGAAAFGFQAAWINRDGQPAEQLAQHPTATIKSLAELPPLLGSLVPAAAAR
jgi:2-haloacid dehalogenase